MTFHKSWSLTPWSALFSEVAAWGAKDSLTVRPWHCPTSITKKQPPGLAAESRYTVSCAPYEMPEEISEWSGTRNVIRPSSTYGTSTRRMKKMANQHQTTEEGMCAAQIAILLRGSSRNNQNEGREDAQWMQETAAAKAENKVMRAGTRSPAEIDLRVCMLIMRPRRGPPRGHPLGGGHAKRVLQEFHNTFHSAWEDQSDTASGSKSETEVEEWDDIIAYNTETSRYTTVANQERRIARDHYRMNKRRCHERRPGYGKTKWLSLPIFWDSTSDNAITYDNWRSDVDNYIQEGHSTKLIRDSVLCALERRPRYTTKTAMDDGDGSLHCIMEVLDSVYGGATTYSALISKLNTIQQGNGEVTKDYYEHIVQLRVKLQEFHHYMFRPGDLEYHAKNAFFNGLHPEYQAMVVHKQDDPQTSITHLLIAVCECEENEAQHCRSRQAEYAKAYPHPRASPLTEPTIKIHTSGCQITIIKIRCVIAGRTTTIVPTSPSMLHRWNLPWRFRPKRITFHRTSIMMTPRRTGMT